MSFSSGPTTRQRRRGVAAGASIALVAGLGPGGVVGSAAAQTAQFETDPDSTLVVEADQPFREVTHVATGSLYGIADEGVPSDDLIAPIKPNTFVQMPPGGRQQPTGDTLDVWRTAERHDAGIVVRIVDYYPGWPYQFSWEDTEDRKGWENVIRDVVADIEEAGVTNVVAYAPWNESDQTWLEANGDFLDLWEMSYNILREELGPDMPIQGPSFSDNISGMREFLEFAVETDTVPDVLEWHELIRSSKIQGDIENVQTIMDDLGIEDRPIDIAEYASPQEVGLPGILVGYIAKLERFGVDRAELAFWNQSGTLGDLLTHRGGDPNGAYWLYTWYADMSGQMVTTTPPSNESPLDGAASVNDAKDEVRVIAGGNSGPTSIVINGLDALELDGEVNVKLEVTASYGRTTPTEAPITISNTTYEVGADGSITVPVVMNPMYGYHVVVSDAQEEPESLAGSYTIDNLHSGLTLAARDAGTEPGTPVVQAEAGDAGAQSWRVTEAGSGLYTIVHVPSGLTLGVKEAVAENGVAAALREGDGGADQFWQLVPDNRGNVRLANYGTGLTLGVEGMSTESGAAVVQWTDGAHMGSCTADGPRQPGKFGTALDFCRADSYVTLPNGVVDELDGDWSVSTWVKPAALSTWSRVFDIGFNSNSSMFFTVSAGSGPRFAITTNGAGGEQRLDYPGQNLTLDEWSLVTVTVSGTTGTMYINGEAVATNDGITISPADLNASNDRNWLGRAQYSSDPPFDGAIDDFAIYSRALSGAEVAELASGVPAAGDVLQYAFDEEEDTGVVIDSSGNGGHGTVTAGSGLSSETTATDEEIPDRFWTLNPVESGEPVEVTPEAVTFTDEDGTEDDTFTIPAVDGVEYLIGAEVVEAGTHPGAGTVTVTVRALDGFVLAEGATAEWSHTFSTEGGEPGPDRRTAEFHLSNTWRGSTDLHFMYGRWADEVFIGDWDGDGVDTIAVRRGNEFHVSNGAGGEADVVIAYGRDGDVILVGDWDGNGTDTFAVRRGATYHVKNSLRGGEADVVITYGRTDDQVLVGDWNGDGTDTFAVRRGATYHVKDSLRGGDADVAFTYGRSGDVTLAGDWDGDGTDTFAVQRGRTYHVNNSLRGGDADTVVTFGKVGDEVHVGDWDGNGTDTLGIRRPVDAANAG